MHTSGPDREFSPGLQGLLVGVDRHQVRSRMTQSPRAATSLVAPDRDSPGSPCSSPARVLERRRRRSRSGSQTASELLPGRSLRLSTRTEPSRAHRDAIVLATLRMLSAR
jgi:hypothetical protein